MTRIIPLLLLTATCAAVGCSSNGDGEGGTSSAYGHLPEVDPRAPQFLMNKAPGSPFRACVAQYMADKLPGVETELTAAVGIWASYLGRTIPVQIQLADLPRATAAQSLDDVSKAYHAKCGEGFDVVVGMAKLDGANVGITGGSGLIDPNTRAWISFSRFLFLRDFDLAPDTLGDAPSTWASLRDATGTSTSADALLDTMKERNTTLYADGGRRLSLPVLTHEIGHVWGLCDQYEGSTNCDPAHSTSHLVTESIMGAATMRERLYLTDDDVAGVRALAARPGFQGSWPAAPTTAPKPITRPDVELFRVDGISRDGGSMIVSYGLVTMKPTRTSVAIRARGANDWQEFVPMESQAAVDTPLMRLTLPVSDAQHYEVRLQVQVKTASGWSDPRELHATE